MNIFKKLFSTNHNTTRDPALVFRSGEAAYEYACKFMDCTLVEGANIPALVMDAREFAPDIGMAVKKESDMSQLAMIKVASKIGGFVIPASTAGSNSSVRPDLVSPTRPSTGHPDLKPGDLVAFTAMTYSKDMANKLGTKESGWMGLITAKLEPSLDVQNEPSIWKMEEKFHD